ncbi:MAG TPA: potassium channel family protein, partial [Elusimicrobiota bacterium]|nr:potassium channel family protein [Elusimicrobiota bacterium]
RKQLEDIRLLWNQRGAGKHVFGIERFVLIFISALLMCMPTMFIRWHFGINGLLPRKRAIEVYAISKVLILFFLLSTGQSNAWYSLVASIIFLVDLFLFLTGLTLLKEFWTKPASHTRTLILLGLNFIEFSLGFAVLYAHYNCLNSAGQPLAGWSGYIYFSIVTSATVGYGDVVPAPGIGRLLASIQILLALGFMATTVAYFVGNLTRERLKINDA